MFLTSSQLADSVDDLLNNFHSKMVNIMNVAPVKVKTVTDKQKAPWKPAVKLLGV